MVDHMDIKAYKAMILEHLYQPYRNCQRCPLATLGRTHVVFGQGDSDASIMFIGEGPGFQEDVEGLPFVGRSGQLLDRVLDAVNIERRTVFITNVVKCRPPNNRQPLPNEVDTCKKLLLLQQIKIVQPKVICTLGAAATQGLLERDIKITKVRGQKFSFEGITVIPTYHPAYILRNPVELTTFADDLALVSTLAAVAVKKE